MVPPVLFTEKMEVTVSDRTLVSVGPARPVSGSVKTLASVSDGTLGSLSDRTLERCVRSC